jgi:hypothetical protein
VPIRGRSSDPAFARPSPQKSGAKSTTPRTAKDSQLEAPVLPTYRVYRPCSTARI